jgi:hypothetical protein
LSLSDFRRIIEKVIEVDVSRNNNKHHLKGLPLEEWLTTFDEKKDEEKFKDLASIHAAYQAIFDSNNISKYK